MQHKELEYMLSSLGRRLLRDKEKVTIDLLGSAALVLGYQCWPKANDIDVRWNPLDSFVLEPLIAEIGKKGKHPRGGSWMNSAISDIIPEDGKWLKTMRYGNLQVRVPSPEFLMSVLIRALHSCEAGNSEYPPYGKAAAECLALASSQRWVYEDIMKKTECFFPRGVPPVCAGWMDVIFDKNGLGKRHDWFEMR